MSKSLKKDTALVGTEKHSISMLDGKVKEAEKHCTSLFTLLLLPLWLSLFFICILLTVNHLFG